ncbi:MAG: hypothetical protein VW270_26670, partial [Candidatus Poseidoniales archaeon]
AGIAAANPPLSFANPAVGAFQVKDAIDAAVATITNSDTDTGPDYGESGKVIYSDYIMGGLAFGVEGTVLTMSDPDPQANPFNFTWNDIAAANYKGYSFSEFVDGEAYMDSQDLNKKKALLEYLYNNQISLKRLLSSFNNYTNNENPAYLGLDENRNIPIYPEWDIAIDNKNNFNAFLTNTPEITWWMSMEAHSVKRPYVYAPGGIRSTRNAESTAKLDKEFRQNWWYEAQAAAYLLQLSTKTFRVDLPDWCQEYDVLVEYTNCTPINHHRENYNTAGLSVEKAKVFSIAGKKQSFFTISSANRSKSDIGLGDGKILDSNNDITTHYDTWLSYAVYNAGFRKQTAFGTGTQAQGANGDITNRLLPKLGASFYPTVKFTIVAYPTSIYSRNATLTAAGSNKTYVPEIGNNGGSAGVIVPQNGITQTIYPPVATDPTNSLTKLDLGNINQ